MIVKMIVQIYTVIVLFNLLPFLNCQNLTISRPLQGCAGNSLTILCTTSSGGPNPITILKNGELFLDERLQSSTNATHKTYTLSPLEQRDDGLQIQCGLNAMRSEPPENISVSSCQVNISVSDPPLGIVGQSLDIKCSMTPPISPDSITLTNVDSNRLTSTSNSTHITYTLSPLRLSDNLTSIECRLETLSSDSVSIIVKSFICKPLDDPLNGMVEFSNRTYGGSMATYSCDDGYELDGDSSTRTCTFNQTDICWTGDAPNCIPASTSSPSTTTDSASGSQGGIIISVITMAIAVLTVEHSR